MPNNCRYLKFSNTTGKQYQQLDSTGIPKRTLNQFLLIGAHTSTLKNREKEKNQPARQKVEDTERGEWGRISKLFVKEKLLRGETKQQKEHGKQELRL